MSGITFMGRMDATGNADCRLNGWANSILSFDPLPSCALAQLDCRSPYKQ